MGNYNHHNHQRTQRPRPPPPPPRFSTLTATVTASRTPTARIGSSLPCFALRARSAYCCDDPCATYGATWRKKSNPIFNSGNRYRTMKTPPQKNVKNTFVPVLYVNYHSTGVVFSVTFQFCVSQLVY